jgi:hypothetical protein
MLRRDSVRAEHPLKVEGRDLMRLMWRYAKQPEAEDSADFVRFMVEISETVTRSPDKPAPPCVFVAEGFVWVHMATFLNWLSLPRLTNRNHSYGDIQQGLILLGFEYRKTHRGAGGESVNLGLWRGPLETLRDDDGGGE